MLAVVPVKGLNGAKTRLAPVLGEEERARLVRAMLANVLAACAEARSLAGTLVVTPEPGIAPPGADVLVDGGTGHADAIAAALADPRARGGALVVMADCPLVRADALDRLAAAARPLAIAPADDGGTSAVALRDPDAVRPAFGVPGSAAVTIRRARAAGVEPAVVAEPTLAFDVDRPEDVNRLILARL